MPGEGDSELHPIFRHDPEEWMQYVYKQVSVVTEDDVEHAGWVYTIDPVSQTVVLVHFADGSQQLTILPGASITKLTILADTSETVKEKLDALFRPQAELSYSEDELRLRRQKLKMWLEKNRLPVEVTGAKGDVLTISDALTIQPPYSVDNCHSTNEIILGRIQGLIKNMPEDHDQW